MPLIRFERRERIAKQKYEQIRATAAQEFDRNGETEDETRVRLLDASAAVSRRVNETARAKRQIQAGRHPLFGAVAYRYSSGRFTVRPLPEDAEPK